MTRPIVKSSLDYRFLTVPDERECSQIAVLYRMADWWEPDDDHRPHLVQRLVAGSFRFIAAFDGTIVVGMARAISDGVNDAYIQDVTVLPPYRHQGVGTVLIERLVATLRQDGIQWIGLIAGGSSHPFYERLGFKAMPLSTPMLLMKEEAL
mgnify:CR=1 FL=1